MTKTTHAYVDLSTSPWCLDPLHRFWWRAVIRLHFCTADVLTLGDFSVGIFPRNPLKRFVLF
jgi:hypothetical protein